MDRRIAWSFLLIAFLGGVDDGVAVAQPARRELPTKTLKEVRKGFRSQLVDRGGDREPIEEPPAEVFHKVTYPAAAGKLGAYLTPDPKDGKKHPAIIWIHGGDCNSIGDFWSTREPSNEQSASAYRRAGIVMMFPSLRGGNDGPGVKEGFLGEVDDVIAAASFLAKQPYVDPSRIYLGGHSTGGTLVLLVAEMTDRFRAVFSFGPADAVSGYPDQFLHFNRNDMNEIAVRSPIVWLRSIRGRTFVFEGKEGNVDALKNMKELAGNPAVSFHQLSWGDHFSILGPMNAMLARKILADTGPKATIEIRPEDLQKRPEKPAPAGAAPTTGTRRG